MFVGEVLSGGGRKKILDVCFPAKIVLDEPREVVWCPVRPPNMACSQMTHIIRVRGGAKAILRNSMIRSFVCG
jgi:hypothetical protein